MPEIRGATIVQVEDKFTARDLEVGDEGSQFGSFFGSGDRGGIDQDMGRNGLAGEGRQGNYLSSDAMDNPLSLLVASADHENGFCPEPVQDKNDGLGDTSRAIESLAKGLTYNKRLSGVKKLKEKIGFPEIRIS
jgi:hypothetical protein